VPERLGTGEVADGDGVAVGWSLPLCLAVADEAVTGTSFTLDGNPLVVAEGPHAVSADSPINALPTARRLPAAQAMFTSPVVVFINRTDPESRDHQRGLWSRPTARGARRSRARDVQKSASDPQRYGIR
jgi:hypothetical protein